MTIAINCWILRNKNLDGIGYFTVNTISNLIRNHPDIHFQILCDKNFTENYFDFKNVSKHPIFPPLRHPVLYLYYIEIVLSLFLKKNKPDIFLSMEGFLSLSTSRKQISFIYDINFEHNPKDLKLRNRLYFRFFYKRFARKATRICTISEYSKNDIAEYYRVDTKKIDNVSCGINSNFSPLDEQQIETIRNKWSGGQPYFFFVGSMHPRKNIKRLLEGFNLFKKKNSSDIKLLLAGSILWSETEIEDAYVNSPYKNDIIFTGRLTDEELQQVLGAALALSFVPIFEGFGLPIVEAMQSGVPVICSNATSMPEVAGDAAVMVDPYNVESIAGGMEAIYKSKSLRTELISRGHLQKQNFSWQKTAQLVWESIEKALH